MKKLLTTIAFILSCIITYAQWTTQTANVTTGYNIQYIDAVSTDVCWGIVADPASQTAPSNEYIRTTDGGATWSGGSITNATGLTPADICAINADTAWAIMFDPSGVQGKVLRTNDGGASWTHQTTALFNAVGNFPDWIHFFDANNGVCLGDPTAGYFEIYTTLDGGTTWERVPSADIEPELAGEWGITDVSTAYGDSALWFGTNLGRIYRSTDRGLHWFVAQTPITDFIGSIAFRDPLNGVAKEGGPSTSTDLVFTNDGGVTWNAVGTNTANIGVGLSMCYVPGTASTYFMSTNFTAYSPNDGVSWIPVDALNHSDIDFVNDSTGWTGSYQPGGLMYKWTTPIATATNDVSSLRISVQKNTGLVVQLPTAYFLNNGLNTQSFNVTMNITGGYTSTKPVTNLSFLDSVQITFDPWTPSAAGPYIVAIYTSLTGDSNNGNDTLAKAVTVYEAFENYGWTSKTNLNTGVFGGALAFSLTGASSSSPGKLYSIGGADFTAVQSGMNTFSDVTNLWSTAPAMPTEKYQFSAMRAGNKIVCSGGYSVGFTPDANTYIFNIASGTWSTGASMPMPVGDYAAGVYRDSIIYYIGGYNGAGDVNDVQFYNVNTNTWNNATAKIGDPVDALRGAINGNTIIVAGGYGQALFGTVAAAYKGVIDPIFPTQISWTAIPDYPAGNASRLAAGTVFNDFRPLIIFAGGDPTGAGTETLSDCWGFDILQNQWFIGTSKTTAVSNVSNLVGTIYNDSLWVASVAGYDGTNITTVNEWLNLGAQVWTGIDDVKGDETNEISVYPNPVNNELTVTGKFTTGNYNITLKNVLGQTVFTQQVSFKYTETNFKLNIAEIPAGVYLLNMDNSLNKTYSVKVIKQ